MKGTISRCLAMLVRAKASDQTWKQIVAASDPGKDEGVLELATADIDDALIGRLLANTCKIMGMSADQACDAFGEYWCCEYAPKIYGATVRRFKSAREMILGMDQVHIEVTASMEKARPPRFDYTWKNDTTLLITYKSPRGMIDVYVGLVRGVGKYFKESLQARKTSPTQVEVVFA